MMRRGNMKKLFVLSTLVFFSLVGLCAAQNYVPGEILVKWKKGVSHLSAQNVQRSLGMKARRTFTSLRINHMKLRPGMKVNTALTQLRQNPHVEYAEPNYIMRALALPNDPQFNQLWGLHNTGQTGGTADADIDAPEAWDIHTGSTDVVIAILDTGIDFDHYDIGNGSYSNIWTNAAEIPGNGTDDDGNGYTDDVHGWDFVGEDNDPTDYYHDYWGNAGHGTHVAGTIAAVGNNSVGITGVNWYTSIMPVRILGASGATDTPRAIAAIMYAADNGAKVINASWGGGGPSEALEDAISYANDRGCLFVAAAGNGGDDGLGDNNDLSPFYPASYDVPNIIAVAGTDHNDALGDFSNYGATSVDVAAPGVQILSSVPVIEINSTVNTAFIEEFDSGLTEWVSWGTNNTWGVSNLYYNFTPPNSLADSPYDNYVDNTDSYIVYDTPFNLVDKYVWMEFDLRCDFGSIYDMFGDYLLVGGDLGDNEFLPIYLLNLDGWYGGSTYGSFTYYWVDLSPLWDIATSIKVGFNLYSNSSITNDGVYIDNVWLNVQDLDITGHDYALFDGTSMATPQVAGLAGLILARYPDITLQELRDRILNGIDFKPNLYGTVLMAGRINAHRSLDPNPTYPDYDTDGMPDYWEARNGLDPQNASDASGDNDGDGLTNLEEYQRGTDPANADTDSDTMPDDWEVQYGLDPVDPADASVDGDGDGYTNLEEYQGGTDPTDAYSHPFGFIMGLGQTSDGWAEAFAEDYSHAGWLRVGWGAYNSVNGEARVATGDIDGDGKDEIVLGLAPVGGDPSTPGGWFQVLDDDHTHLAWGRIQWGGYNSANGESWPACGDVDGDGADEIIVGLGSYAPDGGWLQIFDYDSGDVTHKEWKRVNWGGYNSANGEARPACGDIDGDGRDEIVVGLSSEGDGYLEVFDDALAGYVHLVWGRIQWGGYNSANGESWPACGDVDGDDEDEVIVGLGSYPSSGGWFEIFDYGSGDMIHKEWKRVNWGGYNSANGETRPACGDIDGDGLDEIVIGLGDGGQGYVEVFDDAVAGYMHLDWAHIHWEGYCSNGGETWPGVKE
jgi:subtilisin family serine protease